MYPSTENWDLMYVSELHQYDVKTLTGGPTEEWGSRTLSSVYVTLHGDVASCAEALLEVNDLNNELVRHELKVYNETFNAVKVFITHLM